MYLWHTFTSEVRTWDRNERLNCFNGIEKMLQNSMQRHKLPKAHRSVWTQHWGYRKGDKKGDSSLGNNRPWKLLWERKSEMSRNHQKSREIFKDWFVYLTLHIYKSHDKYFCKWSSTGRSWISTELFSTESLGVRAPDYLGRSSQADALRNKNRLSSRIQFALF